MSQRRTGQRVTPRLMQTRPRGGIHASPQIEDFLVNLKLIGYFCEHASNHPFGLGSHVGFDIFLK